MPCIEKKKNVNLVCGQCVSVREFGKNMLFTHYMLQANFTTTPKYFDQTDK